MADRDPLPWTVRESLEERARIKAEANEARPDRSFECDPHPEKDREPSPREIAQMILHRRIERETNAIAANGKVAGHDFVRERWEQEERGRERG